MTNSQHTEKYCSYFKKQFEQIENLNDRLHKKVLFLVILDTLGRARYPDEKNNKLRFIKVVRDHIQWKDNSRVSLCRILELSQSHNSSKLDLFARNHISSWKNWGSQQTLQWS